MDELAPHSEVRCSVPEVNGPVVQGEFTSLLREICAPGTAATSGAPVRKDRRESTEVSRGHSRGEASPRRPELVSGGSTPSALKSALKPIGPADAGMTDGKHGTPSEELLEQILSRENLRKAWQRVKANGGAPGHDGMTIGAFPAFARQHWERIRSSLKRGTYRPGAVRRVMIPKPTGELRPLGIPTVLDRVIQQAIAQVLTPLFDPHFSSHSYGFRPGRQAHEAVRAVEAANAAGYTQAVDCDLKAFFDTVNHDRLMNRLNQRVTDPRVLRLIGRYLRAGVILPEGQREETRQGVPQGGPLSPLLANIMLDPLDKELERRGHRFARYADDFLILVKSARAARRVMPSVIRFVEVGLGLVVNRQKSQTAPLSRCTFLGFAIKRGKVVWTNKVYRRFKERIKEITSRRWSVSMPRRLEELRRYAVGWLNYFGISHTYRQVLELEQWLRRRVRQCYWKQWRWPRTRRRQLIALGINPAEVKKASRCRRGYWWMSGNGIVQRALNNAWLKEQGVPDLRAQWIELHYGNRNLNWNPASVNLTGTA
jgi:RNA-directed DNA polymerase